MRPLAGSVVLLAALLAVAPVAHTATVTVPGSYPTIQAAFDQAPSGSVIQLAPGVYSEHLFLYSITRTLTLRGDPGNPSAYVIDGGGGRDTVRITSTGSNVSFEGVTITGGTKGYDGFGGGLFMADSHVIFRSCVFTGNSADLDGGGAFLLRSGGLFESCVFQNNSAGRFGGGVIMNLGTTTVFDRCSFIDNEAGTQDVVSGWGGGVHLNASSPLFRRCAIQNNRARYAAGGIGATAFGSAATVTLEDCDISGNVTLQGNATMPPPEGGGMHIENDALAILRRCRVHDNTASRGAGLNNYRARYEIVDSVIEDNTAALAPNGGGTGGGVYAQAASNEHVGPTASVVMSNSVVRGNVADIGAGFYIQGDFTGVTNNQAVLDLNRVLIAGNAAASRAGGVFLDHTAAAIRSSHVLANTVDATTNSWGGGIGSVGSSTTVIDQTTIAENVARQLGGGLFVDQGGRIDVTSSRFWANEAGSAGFGGNGMAVGQQPGSTPGPATGTVANSVLVDDGPGAEIWESNCDLSHYSTILYSDNVIRNPTGGVYFRNCSGATASVGAFNGLGGTKATGNTDGPAAFTSFLAVPENLVAGSAGVVSWCAPSGTGLSVDGGVGALPSRCGTVDVTPATTRTYALSSGGMPVAQASVTVACDGPGTPLPVSPAHESSRPAGTVALSWAAATGATSYDVYLDANPEPTTLVASDVTAISVEVADVPVGVRSYWRVVAKAAGCTRSTPSPVFFFDTCDGVMCEFHDDFDDGDASDWSTSGSGTATVRSGRLILKTKRKLTVFPPAPAVGDGSLSFSLDLQRGRREAHIMFGHRDALNYGEFSIRGTKGQLRVVQKVDKRKRKVGTGKRSVPRGAIVRITLEIAGTSIRALVDGEEVFTGTLSAANQGMFAIQAVASSIAIDDVVVRAR
jgi:hypothetical protein